MFEPLKKSTPKNDDMVARFSQVKDVYESIYTFTDSMWFDCRTNKNIQAIYQEIDPDRIFQPTIEKMPSPSPQQQQQQQQPTLKSNT